MNHCVKCSKLPGMFTNEYIYTIKDVNGDDISGFADQHWFVTIDDQEYLKVLLLDDYTNYYRVYLPEDSSYHNSILINKDELILHGEPVY